MRVVLCVCSGLLLKVILSLLAFITKPKCKRKSETKWLVECKTFKTNCDRHVDTKSLTVKCATWLYTVGYESLFPLIICL